MSTRSYSIRWLGGAVCAVVWSGLSGLEALASGYLPCTGPVPLRFETEKAPPKPLVLPALILDEPASGPPESETPAVPTAVTGSGNVVATNPTPEGTSNPLTDPAASTSSSANPEDAASIAESPDSAAALLDTLYGGEVAGLPAITHPQPQPLPEGEPSASNLLVVTPQMLAEYFKTKPATAALSNAVTVTAFVPVGFTPPSPTGTPSSQATYRTQ